MKGVSLDFSDYLYKKIGDRIKTDRQKRRKTLIDYCTYINHCTDKKYGSRNSNQRIPVGIERQNLSKIEKGEKLPFRGFLSNNQIRALSATLDCDEVSLLLGDKQEIKNILEIMILKCLLNGAIVELDSDQLKKYQKLYEKSQYGEINNSKGVERLSNILFKFLLRFPKLQKQFMNTVFYHSKDTPDVELRNDRNTTNNIVKVLEEVNLQLQEWYTSDKGNIVCILLKESENIVYFFEAFDQVKDHVIDIIIEKFLNNFINNLKNKDKNTSFKKIKDKDTSFKKIIDCLDTNKLFSILLADDIYNILVNQIRKDQIDKTNSLFHLQFIQSLQYQRLFLDKIFDEYKDTIQTYDKFKLYSDMTKLVDFFNSEHADTTKELYINDFINDHDC